MVKNYHPQLVNASWTTVSTVVGVFFSVQRLPCCLFQGQFWLHGFCCLCIVPVSFETKNMSDHFDLAKTLETPSGFRGQKQVPAFKQIDDLRTYRHHCITNPNLMHCFSREIPQNYHMFVLFDSPKMDSLMTPVIATDCFTKFEAWITWKKNNQLVASLGWSRLQTTFPKGSRELTIPKKEHKLAELPGLYEFLCITCQFSIPLMVQKSHSPTTGNGWCFQNPYKIMVDFNYQTPSTDELIFGFLNQPSNPYCHTVDRRNPAFTSWGC